MLLNAKEEKVLQAATQIAHWRYEMEDGVLVRLYVDELMEKFIGSTPDMTPEARSEFFIAHMYIEDMGLIMEYVHNLTQQYSEVEYRYLHPTMGMRTMRCSGLKSSSDDNVIVIVGMHQDISDTLHTRYHQDNKDKILSQLTQRLYSYNITLDVQTGKYTLITGTGEERVVAAYESETDYVTVLPKLVKNVHPGYGMKLLDMLSLEKLRKQYVNGFLGMYEFPVLYPDATDYEWHEINLFSEIDDQRRHIVNILGRDITEAHEQQERNQRELRAAAAKNQVLSDLTKMLYSYNLTLDLNTERYTFIEGTGMTETMEIFRHTDDYNKAFAQRLKNVLPEDEEAFKGIVSLEALRSRKNTGGFIGNIVCGFEASHGKEWHEINVFISTNELGHSIANILGRDITEAHKRQEVKELADKAAAARDQLLSGMTKMLYSFNITVNLSSWKYTLITGTGLEEQVQILQQSDDYVLNYARMRARTVAKDQIVLDELIGTEALQRVQHRSGFIGTTVTEAYVADQHIWQEVNLFLGTNEYGEPIANILGRDVTEAYQQQLEKELELKASVAKDQILSEITKALYSYNITVSLETGRYTLITGTGMEDTCRFFASTDDYEKAFTYEMSNMLPEYVENFRELHSLTALRSKSHMNGHIGQMEYAAHAGENIEWREVNVFLSVDDQGNKVANILGRDISEAHEKADTKAQLEIATKASEAKTSFLFNMSHDIRTPMNAIMGFTDLLDKHQTDPERRHDYLQKIRQSSTILLSIINNVLEMARIEKGTMLLNESAWSAEQFNDTLYSVFHDMMQTKQIEFTRSINVQNHYVYCDPIKLREVFINILSNAYKYTNKGGRVTMTLQEVPSTRPGYANYQTTIADTGIGMSEEFLPHIFEEFSREHTTTENKVEGTGLGMPIVKNLLNMMDGTITVTSKVGEGSTFVVTIPHRIASREQLSSSTKASSLETNFDGKRILLAEDNDLNAEIACEILTEAGFEVERANDGDVCVEMLQKAEPHYYNLILMDIQMPHMNGYQATRAIRKLADAEKANIPIIAMTANAFEEDKREAFNAGMNGHLAKPIVVADLFKTLAEIINAKMS